MRRLRIKAASPHQQVAELSGGNQQKVLLARWLATEPKILLLDEPTRGIDVGAKAEVQALIDELAQDGLGVLLISADLEELVEGSDRVVVLEDGTVVGELSGGEPHRGGRHDDDRGGVRMTDDRVARLATATAAGSSPGSRTTACTRRSPR